jgi:hypothetical protein
MLDDLDLTPITDENARILIQRLLNLIEQLAADLREAQAENQRLRDEVNRLKGEQGKPNIKRNTPKPPAATHSSEAERRESRPRKKRQKRAALHIDRTEVLTVDPASLPSDAEFKGYDTVVVQDVVVQTDNVQFQKEKYYAASTRQTYLAPLPPGYHGQFGPGLRALVLAQYYGQGVSEPKIHAFLTQVGVQISTGQIAALLTQDQEGFHAEKAAVYEAGLRSSPWQQIDDTLTRVDGQNQSCHVVCNPVYSAYFTRSGKDRLTVLAVLYPQPTRRYCLNAEALQLLAHIQLARATRQRLAQWQSAQWLAEVTFLRRLDTELPTLTAYQRQWVLTAAAIAAYHADPDWPVIDTLVCDDAPQFDWLTWEMMLCWVHEGRPYKKLNPFVAQHRTLLDAFLTRFWEYYRELRTYQRAPTPAERERLRTEFDTLFATRTGYTQLDRQIAKTQAKKPALLLVLDHPELPLHNNAAELAVRQRVRKRDISFGPRSEAGKEAWDTFMTLAETTRKLGISFYAYLRDRILAAHAIPPLAELIPQAALALHLGDSWAAP